MREMLNDRFAKSVDPTDKIARYFDTTPRSPRGFLLRVTPAGARAWALHYREKKGGRQREITIGDVRSWPITEARKRGHELRREVDNSGDPLGDREKKRAEPTVAELIDRFEKEALPRNRAATTQAEYLAMLESWVRPALKHLKVGDPNLHDEIEKLHQRITKAGKLRRANSVRAVCSILFGQAVIWRMRNDNPAKGIKGNPEHGRRTYLNDNQLGRLEAAMEEWRPKRPDSVDKIEIAMLTGARRGEILGMRWKHLDLDNAVWKQPPTENKQRDWHSPALSQRAVEILQRRKAERAAAGKVVRLRDDVFVFAGGNTKTARNRFESDWRIIRATAGLNDFRFHDIRHSVASWLISANQNLDVVGQVLGHKKAQTSRRYAHLHDAARRAAAEIIGRKVRRAK